MTYSNDIVLLVGGLALVSHALHTFVVDIVRDMRGEEPPIVPVRAVAVLPDGHGGADVAPALDRVTDVLPEPTTVRAAHVDLPADVIGFS